MRHEQLIELADQRGQVTVAEVQAYFDQDGGPGVSKPNKDTNHETE